MICILLTVIILTWLIYTYFHEGHKSFLDHFFVQNGLWPQIKDFVIVDNGANLSNYLPIILSISIPNCKIINTTIKSHSAVYEFRWDKGDIAN